MSLPDRPAPSVPLARGGVITDQIVDQAAAIFEAARHRPITDAEGALMLMVGAPILRECLARRQRDRLIGELAALPDNVIHLEAR